MPDDAGIQPEAERQSSMMESFARNREDPAASEARYRQWAEEKAEAIESFKAFVRAHGTLGDALRPW